MKDLVIVGAGGLGREILHTIDEINAVKPTWNVVGFLNDDSHALDGFQLGYQVIDSISGWKPSGDVTCVFGIADPKAKERIVPALKQKGARFETIISPTASVAAGSKLGEGVVIFGYTGISVNVTVGDFVFFNAMVGIGHDAVIGDYCTFGPKACISGYTVMGRCVNVGALASTYPGITVGDYATIGMNSAAIRRVKANTTVMGVPAKRI